MYNIDKERIEELKRLIAKFDKQYYEEGISEISDAEYDRLYDEYLAFEKKYPELCDLNDAPTKRVGAGSISGTTTGLQKFTHKSPLLSIDRKAKELSQLKDFYDKCGGEGVMLIIEPKLDGITCNVNYENGKFVNAATRGNGYIGELITDQFKNTDTKYPPYIGDSYDMEVRGEAIVPYDYFMDNLSEEYSNPRNAVAGIVRQINASEVKGKGVQVMFYDIGITTVPHGDDDFSNIKTLRSMGFQSVPYMRATCWDTLKEIVETKMNGIIKEINGFNVLVYPDCPMAVCDGLVVKVASLKQREEIGMSEKGPKWAFAFKFKPLQAETRIDHIEWQVGKTGKVTPVAVFNEISLGGTKITRATLNNYDYMQSLPVLGETRIVWEETEYDNWMVVKNFGKDRPFTQLEQIQEGDILEDLYPEKSQGEMRQIKVKKIDIKLNGFWIEDIENSGMYDGEWYPFEEGRYYPIPEKGLRMDDTIIVERSNDVIPRIIAIKNHNTCVFPQDKEVGITIEAKMDSFKEPKICPDCGHELKKEGPLHYCMNPLCKSQVKGKIIHYASRDALNIIGLGESIVDILFEKQILKDIPSIYKLSEKREELMQLSGFGTKKVDKLIASIEKAKNPELWQLIYALSINGAGKKTAKDLASRFHTMEEFQHATLEELLMIEDMGEITARNILGFLNKNSIKQVLKSLRDNGVEAKPIKTSSDKFKGMSFVITGTLERPRSYYQEVIEYNGGKVSGNVSKKTSVVIIGKDAGSKEAKARKLVSEGIGIILLDTEKKVNEFLELDN